jgi:hypothetical protein
VVLDKDTVVMPQDMELEIQVKDQLLGVEIQVAEIIEAIVWEAWVKKDLLAVCQIKQEVI